MGFVYIVCCVFFFSSNMKNRAWETFSKGCLQALTSLPCGFRDYANKQLRNLIEWHFCSLVFPSIVFHRQLHTNITNPLIRFSGSWNSSPEMSEGKPFNQEGLHCNCQWNKLYGETDLHFETTIYSMCAWTICIIDIRCNLLHVTERPCSCGVLPMSTDI